ncbi:MAG: selenocysteine-specific translation elongation factor, partial [Gemmatimonadales bacterium]
MIIGTAGHIDHGKSALVEALTGQAMDRLAEERKRGITIDLNFAPLALGGGRVAGIVDVPGHEDLVRTMVAGASGMDLLLLVVAANEGIMPQTREHLAIAEQLALPLGIPVITKADLAEPEWLELVRQEVDEWLRPSPIRFTPAIAVSAIRGDGLEELRTLIEGTTQTVAPRAADDIFRLPVDRVFSVAGIGTVVTGTAWSGAVAVGDPVRVVPGGREGRIRSIESHGRSLGTSQPGARTALGISGLERREVGRGDQLVAAGVPWTAATVVDVWVHLLPGATRVLTHRTRVRLHHGTAELLARISPRQAIEPGGSGLARLALEAPAVVRGGDRFVLRSYSPVITVGGGWVVDPT